MREVKSIEQLKIERETLEESILRRSMLEALLECYADRAEISIRHPDKHKGEDTYIIQVYIPLETNELNKMMEGI